MSAAATVLVAATPSEANGDGDGESDIIPISDRPYFDISVPPAAFDDENAETYANDYLPGLETASTQREEDHARFLAEKRKDVSISYFRQLYESGDKRKAIRSLSQRRRIQPTDDEVYKVTDPKLFVRMEQHFLDWSLYVGSQPGFDVFLPLEANREGFEFTLELFTSQQRSFTAKYGYIGSPTGGRVMYIGKAGAEEIFLLWAPLDYILYGELKEDRSGAGVMQRVVYTIAKGIILSMFERHSRVQAPHIPENSDAADGNLCLTPGMQFTPSVSVTWDEMQKIDDDFKDEAVYSKVVETVCAKFQQDYTAWFMDNRPIALAHRCGQNKEFLPALRTDRDKQRQAFHQNRYWDNVRFANMSIATHFEAFELESPDDAYIKVDGAYLHTCGRLFKDPSCSDESRIDPATYNDLPEVDPDTGYAPRLYNDVGMPVDLVTVPPQNLKVQCGVLADFNKLRHVLEDPISQFDDDYEDDIPRPAHVDYYPQAGLATTGNFQSDGTLRSITRKINKLNKHFAQEIVDANEARDESEDESEDVAAYSSRPAISCYHLQGYCNLAHAATVRAGQFPTTKGYATGLSSAHCNSFGGAWTQSCTEAHQRCEAAYDDGNPVDKLHTRLTSGAHPPCFRYEQTISLDMWSFIPASRNGRSLYNLLGRLTGLIKDKAVKADILGLLKIYRPQLLEGLYGWVMFPANCLLLKELEICLRPSENRKADYIFRIEIIAMLERVIAYLQTGHRKLLPIELLSPAKMLDSCTMDGVPMLDGNILQALHMQEFTVSYWPVFKSGLPHRAARSSQRFHFNEDLAEAFGMDLYVQVILGKEHSVFIMDLAMILVNTYQRDILAALERYVQRTLLSVHVPSLAESRSNKAYNQRRLTALRRLRLAEYPFDAYDVENIDNLKVILNRYTPPDPEDPVPGDPSRNPLARAELALTMMMVMKDDSFKAPFIARGTFRATARTIVPLMRKMVPSDGEVGNAFIQALINAKISLVPWSHPPQQLRGRPPHRVYIDHFRQLVGNPGKKRQLVGQDETEDDGEENYAHTLQAADPNRPWSVADLELRNLRRIIRTECLPTDYVSYAQTRKEKDFWTECAKFAVNKWRGPRELDKYILLVSLVFAFMAPNCGFDQMKCKEKLRRGNSQDAARITAALLNAPRTKSKSVSKEKHGCFMFITLMAMLRPDSPLNQLARNVAIPAAFSKNKSNWDITICNLVRLGVVKQALSRSCITGSAQKDHFQLATIKDVTRIVKTVYSLLDNTSGIALEYEILILFTTRTIAVDICTDEGVGFRLSEYGPMELTSEPSDSSRKRRRGINDRNM